MRVRSSTHSSEVTQASDWQPERDEKPDIIRDQLKGVHSLSRHDLSGLEHATGVMAVKSKTLSASVVSLYF